MPAYDAPPTSTPIPAILAPAACHLVWVRCLTPLEHSDATQWPAWLAACHRLTPLLQRFGPATALLDLGPRTDTEAVAAVQALIAHLHAQHITLCAAIAFTGTLAQFALLQLMRAPTHESLMLLTTEQAPDLLRALPITALTQIEVADQTLITLAALAQAVARLDGYGARSCRQPAWYPARCPLPHRRRPSRTRPLVPLPLGRRTHRERHRLYG